MLRTLSWPGPTPWWPPLARRPRRGSGAQPRWTQWTWSSWPGRAGTVPSLRSPSSMGPTSSRWPTPLRRFARCSTSTPRRASGRWSSRWPPPSGPASRACWPATRRPASMRSTRSMSPGPVPAGLRARTSTTARWPPKQSTGAMARGSADRAAPAASCAGSPIRSAGSTATGAACPDALALVPAFPGVQRVTARVAATPSATGSPRVCRCCAGHTPKGAVGAVRVEVRGRRGTGSDVRVLGAMDRPAVAAGAVAAVTAAWAADGRLARAGAAGLGRAGRRRRAVPAGAGPTRRARRRLRGR